MFIDLLRQPIEPSSNSAYQAPVRCRSCGTSCLTTRRSLVVIDADTPDRPGVLYHEISREYKGEVLTYKCSLCGHSAIIGG